MPYFGHTPTNAGSFIEIDDYGSSFNGSTTAFTLQVGGVDVTPNSQNILVMIDGVVQMPTSAYSISGSTITYTEAPPSGADSYVILMGQSASIGQGTIGADELKISGNGTSGQLVKSDGDGTYSYLNQTSVTAGTATTLATARTINGVSFDGSANITVTADANTLSNTTLKSTVVNSSLTSVGTLTSLNTTGAVTATGSDYMLKAVSTSTSNNNAIRVSAESGLAQGKIEIGWHNDSSETAGGYGSIQVGKSANTPEIRIGASAVRIGTQQGSQELKVNRSRMRHIDGLADANANFSHGDLYVNHISTGNIYMQRATTFANRLTLSGDGSGNGIFMGTGWQIFDNASESYGSTGSLVFFNGSSRVEMRENGTMYMAGGFQAGSTLLGTVNISSTQYAVVGSNSSSRGIAICRDGSASFPDFRVEGNGNVTINNALSVGSSISSGNITADTGGTSIITVDGNNNSGDDGRILLKGHTAGTSRAYAYFNNGITSGGLNWYVGNLRGSNAFTITCGNDDAPGYGGGSFNDTVMVIDGNRKMGIGNNPGSQKLRVYNDATDYTVQFQNNQGDGAVLDLYASSSDDHSFDPIFRARTDAQNLFMIDNKGNWYSGDNFVSNPWDLTSGEGGLYFQTGYNNSGQTFAIANNQDRGYANMYSNAINADATDGRHIQWMNDGTPAGHVHFNSSNSVAYNTTQSDKTLKKNFADWTENILDSFDKINPQLFHFKIQEDSEEKVKGFIAQEMVDKFPEAYPMGAYGEGDNKETKYHFNPSGMVVYLMKAIKELSDKIKILEGN